METNDMTSKEIKNTAPVPSPKPPRKRLKKIVTGCLIAAATVVLYGFFGPNFLLPYTSGYLHVRSDMTAADVGDALTDKGYIASPLWFRAAAMATGQAGSIHAGEYTFNSRMSVFTILQKLASGKSEADRLVVPEGYTVWNIAKAVAANGRISEADFLKAAASDAQLFPYMKGNRQVTFATEGFLRCDGRRRRGDDAEEFR